MKSSQFLQALRKIIREEVQTAVRTELNNFGIIAEQQESRAMKLSSYVDTYKPKPATKNQFVKDPILNDILNETAGHGSSAYGYTDYNDYSEWPTMNMGAAKNFGMSKQPTPLPVTTDVHGNRIDMNKLAQTEAGAAVVDALTKDYSSLMKAIDKKKGK